MHNNIVMLVAVLILAPSMVIAMSDDESGQNSIIEIPDRYFEYGNNYNNPEYDRRFYPYFETIKEFVIRHNLLIHKYYHDGEAWSLLFQHPNGGQAKIDIWIRNENEIEIQTFWWRDEYSKWTRFLKWGDKQLIAPDAQILSQALSTSLREVLDWKPDEWTTIANDCQELWSPYTKEEFEAMTPKWPLVKP